MLSISIDHHLRAVASEKACTGFERGKHLFVNHQECLNPRVFAAVGDLHDAEINDAISFETQQHDCEERIQRRMRERTAFVARQQFVARGDKVVRAQSMRGRVALDGLCAPAGAPWLADFRAELLA